jgi:hypothetical protein
MQISNTEKAYLPYWPSARLLEAVAAASLLRPYEARVVGQHTHVWPYMYDRREVNRRDRDAMRRSTYIGRRFTALLGSTPLCESTGLVLTLQVRAP